MIARLTGTVLEREAKSVVVEAGGVGYQVAVLPRLAAKIKQGESVTLRTYHHVSAEAQELYGFADRDDLRYFELLLTVPSVGPRTAMGVLEIAPPRVLEAAVAGDDTALLTKVSGVGRKTAERILVELKGKIAAPLVPGTASDVQQEAVDALVSLGFTLRQARAAVQKLPPDIATVEEAVRTALQQQAA
jgi:Holliday junction DNA helicase RuvA